MLSAWGVFRHQCPASVVGTFSHYKRCTTPTLLGQLATASCRMPSTSSYPPRKGKTRRQPCSGHTVPSGRRGPAGWACFGTRTFHLLSLRSFGTSRYFRLVSLGLPPRRGTWRQVGARFTEEESQAEPLGVTLWLIPGGEE